MCSIAACLGANNVQRTAQLLESMTYRGYDSAGIACLTRDKITIQKSLGTDIDALQKYLPPTSEASIGQTRWATRGKNDLVNTNPQTVRCDTKGEVAVVMNGIITDYEKLRVKFENEYGCKFTSDNDTELVAHAACLADNLFDLDGMLGENNRYTAIVLRKGMIGCIRHGPSLILGKSKDGTSLASDIHALASCGISEIAQVPHDSIVDLNTLNAYNINDTLPIQLKFDTVALPSEVDSFKDSDENGKGTRTEQEFIEAIKIVNGPINEHSQTLSKISNSIWWTGSGSSYHMAQLGAYLTDSKAVPACEIPFVENVPDNLTMVAISQSGETGDVLKAIEHMNGTAQVYSILNNTHSSLAALSDVILDMKCGPEQGVAATKSLAATARIILDAFYIHNKSLSTAFNPSEEIIKAVLGATDIYLLGSGIVKIAASEGALKLKELIYKHAEAMHAGEFKHGPLAVLDEKHLVIILDTDGRHADTASEIIARGGRVLLLSSKQFYKTDYFAHVDGDFLANVLWLQSLAIQAAKSADLNVDRPRHLAKCVTV